MTTSAEQHESQQPNLPDPADQEPVARRLLGSDAAFCLGLGTAIAATARPVGRSVELPGWLVGIAGLATAAWGLGVGVASVAEDWQAPTRVVAGTNVLTSAGLLGLAATRGRPAGRIATVAAAGCVAGFGYRQVRALVAAQGPVVA